MEPLLIIDKSLLDLYTHPKALDFALGLYTAGITGFELCPAMLESSFYKRFNAQLPECEQYYKIECFTELKKFHRTTSRYTNLPVEKMNIILPLAVWQPYMLNPITLLKGKLILEVEVFNQSALTLFKDRMLDIQTEGLYGIKITGLTDCILSDWSPVLDFCQKNNLKIFICPDNRFNMGIATALHAFQSGMMSFIGSFAGHVHDSLPEEVLLLAIKVLKKHAFRGDLTILDSLKDKFEGITGQSIPFNKPAIGSRIFYCESGIHVDGLHKSGETYEPYPPEWTGKTRTIVLGKHSGLKALDTKLAQMDLNCAKDKLPELLKVIHIKSAKINRSLTDTEVYEVYKAVQEG